MGDISESLLSHEVAPLHVSSAMGKPDIVRDIPVRSVCEHHLLPFSGRASIGYLPGERIVGLSKLAHVMEHFACRPQTQERLTKQVAQWLQEYLHPNGVGVVVQAERRTRED